MSNIVYYGSWLLAALVCAAVASALITRGLARRELRRWRAEDMLVAVARYSEWLAAQQRNPCFDGERAAPAAFRRARGLAAASFPELSPLMADLQAVHDRVIDFLWRQAVLRLRDPEAWLDTDHDGQFMALWRDHARTVQAIAQRLQAAAGGPLVPPHPDTMSRA